MKIGKKITLYFSTVTITLIGLFFIFIYTLFAEYREEEFQKRLKEKTITTLRFLAEIVEIDHDLLQAMDRFTINNLYLEKVLLFNEHKKLIYSGIDDTKIIFSKDILEELSSEVPWIETTEEDFDVVGVYMQFENKSYYGITKAYDTFGFSKLNYLRNILIFTFIALSLFTILVTLYISTQISQPLNKMTAEINSIKFDSGNTCITVPDTQDEIHFLAREFNRLMERLNNAFAFQKHAIHHISHELKTPIAILVANFEKLERESHPEKMRALIKSQKEDTKNLSNIINALLEIAKVESGHPSLIQHTVRIDDLIYDLIEEVKKIYPDFSFEVNIEGVIEHEGNLTVPGNKRLLASAFLNLMVNCVQYSNANGAGIVIRTKGDAMQIDFKNTGRNIQADETQYLFQHFFRGSNSRGKRGFGLGLVLVNKIVQLHHGTVEYLSEDSNSNLFRITLLLS